MRMPRITTRRMMIAVAISAIILWLFQPPLNRPTMTLDPISTIHWPGSARVKKNS